MSFIDPEKRIGTSLLCLNPHYIGGAMVVYRSLICGHDLTMVEPTANLSIVLENEAFDLASMVPIQFNVLTSSQLDKVGTILIGGAPIDIQKTESRSNIFSTFGMTETVSHIALRPLNDVYFTTTGDAQVAVTGEGLLKIKGSITDHNWLTTNDIVELISTKQFKWVGRQDFIINTGGIKVNPEDIERQLKETLDEDFIIGSLPDDKLGNKIIFISSGNEQPVDFSRLGKYHKPKATYFNQTIFKTDSGKIDRRKTLENLDLNP